MAKTGHRIQIDENEGTVQTSTARSPNRQSYWARFRVRCSKSRKKIAEGCNT